MDVLAFFVVAAVVIVTPAQDTALTIRNTLAGARRAARDGCGRVGLAAVVAASEPVFDAIKLAGAAYLVVLGFVLRDDVRRRARVERGRRRSAGRVTSAPSAIRRVLDAVVGVVLVSLGLRLATERR